MYYESVNIEIIRNTGESIKRSFDLEQSAKDGSVENIFLNNCISSPSTGGYSTYSKNH